MVAIALLTQTSMGPSSRSMAAAADWIARASATSAGTGSARAPSASISRCAAKSRLRSRAISATAEPWRANSSAVARPTPALAPVMATTPQHEGISWIAARGAPRGARKQWHGAWRVANVCRDTARLAQVFVEEVDRTLPGQLGGFFVVARRGVVVEAVLRTGIHVHGVLDVVGLERLFVSGNSGVDALIVLRIVEQQGRLDFGHIGGGRLRTVECDGGIHIGAHSHGQPVRHAAAEAEADDADLAGALRAALEVARGGDEILGHLCLVEGAEELDGFLFAAGITALGGQRIRGNGVEIGDSEAARDIFDVRIPAAIFVHHDDAGKLARFRRPRAVAIDGAVALRRFHDHRGSLDSRIILRHLLRPRVIVLETLQDGQRRKRRGSESLGDRKSTRLNSSHGYN